MTDATTRQHARPNLDADPLEVALAAWRRGQPCDLPTLTRAGAITIGQAREGWRSGLWEPEECDAAGAGRGAPCPVCLGTRYEWSERHAELLAYAGEESLRRHAWGDWWTGSAYYSGGPLEHLSSNEGPDARSVQHFVDVVGIFSTLAPLAAAWGVAREWALERDGGSFPSRGERADLGAVWRYLCDPSEEGRAALPDGAARLVDGRRGRVLSPIGTLCLSVADRRGFAPIANVIGWGSWSGLPFLDHEATSRAAREGVRRWAGRVWGVEL